LRHIKIGPHHYHHHYLSYLTTKDPFAVESHVHHLWHQYEAMLVVGTIDEMVDSNSLAPLRHCSLLQSVKVTVGVVDRDSAQFATRYWTWSEFPPSLTYFSLTANEADRFTALALPITWQQQLITLKLDGGWWPKFVQITDPWLSLTCFSYRIRDTIINARQTAHEKILPLFIDLFTNKSHLLPNLTDLQIPHFHSNELIHVISNNLMKLQRLDMGNVSALPLQGLIHLSSVGIGLS
jgi:hypothetical protein